MELNELVSWTGLTRTECVSLFNVTDRTYKNWVRFGAPGYVIDRLSMMAGTHKDWKGTKICSGFIITSNGTKLSKNQIDTLTYSIQLNHRLIEILESRIAEFENDQSMIRKSTDHDRDKSPQKTRLNSTGLPANQHTYL